MEEADRKGCRYVIATDPDADRFICAEKNNSQVLFIHNFQYSGMCSREMKSELSLLISYASKILIVKAV